jgi:glycosyltransferase involved in cell wall biosynthesis
MATSSTHIPRLSVIMPVHNAALYLRQALRSILDQDFADFELLLINDGSSDESETIMSAFTDARIHIIQHQSPMGVAYSMNEAFERCRGEFVARMDADDISEPTRFSKQIRFLDENPHVGVVFTRISQIDVYGNPAGEWTDDARYVSEEEIVRCMPSRNCLANPTFMMRRNLTRTYRYSTSFRVAEDYAYWLGMLARGVRMAKLNEVLLRYRIHPSSLTQTDNRTNPHAKFLRFQRNYLSTFITSGPWNAFHLRLLCAFMLNIFLYPWRAWFRPLLSVVKKLVRANIPGLIISYLQLKRYLKKHPEQRISFFFPFYHVGGAERVHADIVGAVGDNKSMVFFTKKSENNGFLERFTNYASCTDIWRLCWYPVFRSVTAKLIAKHINQRQDAVVFGCNSVFFYSLIPHLREDVRVVDLIHAFMHPEEDGAEKWSLPYVKRINHRVLISRKAIDELTQQYHQKGIDSSLLNRVVFIRNYTPLFSRDVQKLPDGDFRVIYLGRGTAEKRLEWISDIAERVITEEKSVQFSLAGKDLDSALVEHQRAQLHFDGEITSDERLMEWLGCSHVLLLTSAREGFPMVIMEAMANGVVPVCTAVGDIPNVIIHGENGFLIDASDREEGVRQSTDIILELKRNPELFRKIRMAAYQTAESQFGSETFKAAYRKLLLS